MSPRYPKLAGLAALLLSAAAQAQTPPAQTTPQAQPPQSQERKVVPERPGDQVPQGRVPQEKPPGSGTSSLSEQLSNSGGVIHPPTRIDKPMTAPTPDPGARSTPVIPPPGTPGGNPDVKPK